MAVYVDKLFTWPIEHTDPSARALARRTGGRWCHLTADTVEELHAFAGALGLKRAWFQNHPRHPHYDLTPGKRASALRHGAIEVGRMSDVQRMASRTQLTASEWRNLVKPLFLAMYAHGVASITIAKHGTRAGVTIRMDDGTLETPPCEI